MPSITPSEECLPSRRVTFSSLRRVMRNGHSIQQSNRLTFNAGLPAEPASLTNLAANSRLNLHIQIGLPRMRHLALHNSAVQHRVGHNRLINSRDHQHRLPHLLRAQSIHQISDTSFAINNDLRSTTPPFHKEIHEPLRTLRHWGFTDALHMHAPIRGLQRPSNSDRRPIRRELHTKRPDTLIRGRGHPRLPRARNKGTLTTLPLIPNPQTLTLKALNRPQKLPHAQNRALTRAKRVLRIYLRQQL